MKHDLSPNLEGLAARRALDSSFGSLTPLPRMSLLSLLIYLFVYFGLAVVCQSLDTNNNITLPSIHDHPIAKLDCADGTLVSTTIDL